MNPADNSPLWIRGARVIDPSAKRDEAKGDVFALDGKFVDKLSTADQAKARVIDGTGLVVAPGFVDLNCRLGEPGLTPRETIRTGTRAAAAGGFTCRHSQEANSLAYTTTDVVIVGVVTKDRVVSGKNR